jgi:Tfp pilus assembly protein PilO
MTFDLRPWRRLLAVWLPAIALCAAAAALFLWQSSESGGRRAQVRSRIEELEREIARLEGLRTATSSDRARVAELERQFATLHGEVFQSLDERLTDILRAVGSATRDAGLLPGNYAYTAAEDRGTGFIRFGIQFSVEGQYRQIRQMLAALQESPEFLLVEGISLAGEEAPVSQQLRISVRLATFLVDADPEQLRRLTGGIGGEGGEG